MLLLNKKKLKCEKNVKKKRKKKKQIVPKTKLNNEINTS